MSNKSAQFRVRACKAATIFALTATLTVGSASPATAHHTSRYGLSWTNDDVITYHIDPDMGSAWANRVIEAAIEWNAANVDQEVSFSFIVYTDAPSIAADPCTVVSEGGIKIQELDGLTIGSQTFTTGTQGATRWCTTQSDLTRAVKFLMVVDRTAGGNSNGWYTGTSTPGAKLDALSVLAHEFGHATGWTVHFDEANTACPTGAERRTMCPGIYNGTTDMRDLKGGDASVFQAEYPAPGR